MANDGKVPSLQSFVKKKTTQGTLSFEKDMIPGTLWKHFRGKIYSLVTPALGHNNNEQMVVLQDTVNREDVKIRLFSEFNEVLVDGRPRYSQVSK